MFDFAFYGYHQGMLDLEARGVHAFLRDENGDVIYLCNDGNVYCNITQCVRNLHDASTHA